MSKKKEFVEVYFYHHLWNAGKADSNGLDGYTIE
jgi:hypothetical protein